MDSSEVTGINQQQQNINYVNGTSYFSLSKPFLLNLLVDDPTMSPVLTLAIFIEKVHRLEAENMRLIEYSRKDGEIKELYSKELEASRKLIEELALEKARLEIEVYRNRTRAEKSDSFLSSSRMEMHLNRSLIY